MSSHNGTAPDPWPRRRVISLDGVWRYTPVARVTITAGDEWAPDETNLPPAGEMPVPSHWERAGLADFAGAVRFERAFTAPELAAGESLWLICHGVDYFAHVALNGRRVGAHEGYFQRWELDLTPYLQHGANALSIEVTCPREEPGAVWPDNKRQIKGILNHWDCRPGSWDPATGQDIHSGGIWNSVALEVRPPISIARADIQTWLTPPNEALSRQFDPSATTVAPHEPVARVMVSVRLAGAPGQVTEPTPEQGAEQPADQASEQGPEQPANRILEQAPDQRPGESAVEPLWLDVRIGPHTARVAVEAATALSTTTEALLTIPTPRLWWTWDHGEPYLYPCTITLSRGAQVIDRHERMVGIRELSLDPESGIWTLNGRRIFVRGTNIIPTLWLGEYDGARIDRDIALLQGAHVNGVRICVHVNREELYDALDRAGILVWQDFALQWGYQQSDAFIAEAIRQVKDMVRQLRRHPCIALWCCQNESTRFNHDVLDPLLARAAREEDSSRYVRPTSEFAEHLYPGWYYGHLRDYDAAPTSAIVTEFGAQALPSAEEVGQMVGEGWPPDWRRLAYHNFQYDQTFCVAGITTGAGWDEFVASSQAYQATLLKTAIERFRRARYAPVGGLFQFMFMDCWPSITWSVVSYDRVPKAGYAALRTAYQPVLVGAVLGRDSWLRGAQPDFFGLSLWVANDRAVAYADAHITVTLCDDAANLQTEVAGAACAIAADSLTTLALPRTALALPLDWPAGDYTLRLRLTHDGTILSANAYPFRIAVPPPSPG